MLALQREGPAVRGPNCFTATEELYTATSASTFDGADRHPPVRTVRYVAARWRTSSRVRRGQQRGRGPDRAATRSSSPSRMVGVRTVGVVDHAGGSRLAARAVSGIPGLPASTTVLGWPGPAGHRRWCGLTLRRSAWSSRIEHLNSGYLVSPRRSKARLAARSSNHVASTGLTALVEACAGLDCGMRDT